MKQLPMLLFTQSFLLILMTGFSQDLYQKFELNSTRDFDDSRFTVTATVMEDDSWCLVEWPDPFYPWELAYDDGEIDDIIVYSEPGCQSANLFTPNGYPFLVTGGRVFVWDGSFPGPFIGVTFRVLVYNDDGDNEMPGTALDSIDVTVNNYGWVEFEGLTAEITEGDFYLSIKQLTEPPQAVPVGADMDNPTYNISYSYLPGMGWVTSPLQDFMIRSWIEGYYEPEREIDYFEVARFSGFDPDGSPLLGDTIVLETVYESYYEDFTWEELDPGYYAYGVRTHFSSGVWSDYDVSNIVPHGLDFYPPSCFYQSEDGNFLVVCPPVDEFGNIPQNLLGINLYRDGEFVGYYPNPPGPEADTLELGLDLLPGVYDYACNAEYDLTSYGYPGETSQSDFVTTECVMRYGFQLDFQEQWNTGTFETNSWTTDSQNWQVNITAGNPAPSVEFSWEPAQQNYVINLTGYPFLADSMTEGQVFLDFDLKLQNIATSGTEHLLVKVWNWENRVWTTIKSYSNDVVSFDWIHEHLDISQYAMNQVFMIRFAAEGDNSLNLEGWYVDNIHVYRFCVSPGSLEAQGGPGGIRLEWDGFEKDQWVRWDDGENHIGIGHGASAEFDVAARWSTDQLTYFDGDTLTDVAFYPREAQATYRIRVWIGQGAANLIYDREVDNPVIGQWNYVPLLYPIIVDGKQELWVGYNVDTPVGYPAGVDDGPAIDGYGNMIDFGGWQTLKQMNPDLDYNWNIAAFLRHNMDGHEVMYAIYRSDDSGPYFLRDDTEQDYYLDDSVCMLPPWHHEYKVTALHIFENDTCESAYSNLTYEICSGISEFQENLLHVYPNPAYDVLFIEASEEIESFSIFNGRGEEVKGGRGNDGNWRKMEEWKIVIPVNALTPGLYLVRVIVGKEMVSKKIIVIKG